MNENCIVNYDVKVFEDQFTCWNRLPMELKVKVARNLPYPTLWNFMFLSKECIKISSLLKTSVRNVVLYHPPSSSLATVVVTPIESAKLDVQDYITEFSSLEDGGCVAHRKKKEGQTVIMGPEYRKESCYTVSLRMFFQIAKNLRPKNIVLQLVNIADVKSSLSKLPSTSLITCGELTVRAPDLSFLSLLMPHLAPGCNLELNLEPHDFDIILHSAFFDFEVVKAAPLLIITCAVCEINDEQLIHLRASWLDLEAPRIPEKGINELILQWMKGKRKIASICIWTTEKSNCDMVFENLKKIESRFSCDCKIPFSVEYVELGMRRHVLVRDGLGNGLYVYIGENGCKHRIKLKSMNETIPNLSVDVFEDRFTCWNRLPMELKVEVIRNLPYPTLRNFMFLSKECMEVSSLLRASVFAVFLVEETYRWSPDEENATGVESSRIVVSDMPYRSTDADNEYVIGFSSVKGRSCMAHRRKEGGRNAVKGVEYPVESCFTVSMRVFFEITKNLEPKNVVLELANIADVKSTLSQLPSTSLITCGALTVRAPDLSFLSMLMPRVAPGCELRFYDIDPYPAEDNILNSAFFDVEVVKAAPYLATDAVCEINDGKLINLRASWLDLKAPDILEKSINELILQWMEGRRKVVRICITETKALNYDMVFENVNKIEIDSSYEQLQIPFLNNYVKKHPLHKGLALICNGLGDRLLVNIDEDYCELVDPYSEYMSLTYR